MDAKDFNIKCAEFMGYTDINECGENICSVTDEGYRSWSPYSYANDRNKVIEKMRIKTNPFNSNHGGWSCDCILEKINKGIVVDDKSMEAAQIKCIEKVLEGV